MNKSFSRQFFGLWLGKTGFKIKDWSNKKIKYLKKNIKSKLKILIPTPKNIANTNKINSRNLIYSNIINSGSVIVELGVWKGVNAKLIYSYNPKYLYLIDVWSQQDDETYKLDKGGFDQLIFDEAYTTVKCIFKDQNNVKIIKDYGNNAVLNFADESIDIIYIDAAHYYEAVKNDLEKWYPKVKKNGYICGDDYIKKPSQKFGVIKAVDEFIKNYDIEIVYFDDKKTFPLPGHGQYCLKKL